MGHTVQDRFENTYKLPHTFEAEMLKMMLSRGLRRSCDPDILEVSEIVGDNITAPLSHFSFVMKDSVLPRRLSECKV